MAENTERSSSRTEQDEPSTTVCYDCEQDIRVTAVQYHEVMVHHDEGMGYDMIRVPLCRGCVFERFGVTCEECGEQFLDVDDLNEHHAWKHSDDHGQPMPDGGER